MKFSLRVLIRSFLARWFAKNLRTRTHFAQQRGTTPSKTVPSTNSVAICCKEVGGSNVANGYVWGVDFECVVDDYDDDWLGDCPENGHVREVHGLGFVGKIGELGGVPEAWIDTTEVVRVCCCISMYFSQIVLGVWVNDGFCVEGGLVCGGYSQVMMRRSG